MASFWRHVGIVHSTALLRVSHQGHHFRVRYFQALRVGINFISLKNKQVAVLNCNGTSLEHKAYKRAFEFPSSTVNETQKVISGCLSLFSKSSNLCWSGCSNRDPCFHRMKAQSSLRSCKASAPRNQCYAKNRGTVQQTPDACEAVFDMLSLVVDGAECWDSVLILGEVCSEAEKILFLKKLDVWSQVGILQSWVLLLWQVLKTSVS